MKKQPHGGQQTNHHNQMFPIDYDKMFEKSFLEPLNSLLSCIGWQVKETASLEGLFG